MPDINEIVQGTVDTIEGIDEIGLVVKKDGEASNWSFTDEQNLCFWVVDHKRSESKQVGLGGVSPGSGRAALTRRIVVDVWSPWSYEINTAYTFRDKLESVERELSTHRGLGVCARMLGMPEIIGNRIEPFTSNNQNDVARLCHHAVIAFDVIAHPRVEAS
jgi:hypothetical protein